jgi:hypothetical protein
VINNLFWSEIFLQCSIMFLLKKDFFLLVNASESGSLLILE